MSIQAAETHAPIVVNKPPKVKFIDGMVRIEFDTFRFDMTPYAASGYVHRVADKLAALAKLQE